jgi:NAD-dependent dihydropyrimidine dehydrogenase PreA subunit
MEEHMPNVRKWQENGIWVEIDLDLCNGAGKCTDVCPVGVYEIADRKVNADSIGECAECGSCEGECPNNAILSHSAWD